MPSSQSGVLRNIANDDDIGKDQNGVVRDRVRLKRQISLFQGVAIIVGSIIGSGIFISPVGVLLQVKSVGLSLVIWVVCAVVNALMCYCWAELGTLIPRSGGNYTYIKRNFGNLAGFLVLYDAFFLSSPAVNCLVFAAYVLQPIYMLCGAPSTTQLLLAMFAYTLLSIVNSVNVRWTANLTVVFTVCKLSALVIVIIAGIKAIAQGNVENLAHPFEGSDFSAGAIALAIYSGNWAYGGGNVLNLIIDEIKDPIRNLPRSIAISITLVTVVYLLTNVAYFTILTKAEMLESQAVAVVFGGRIHSILTFLMPVFVSISVIGNLNNDVLAGSRVLHIAAEDGLFPQIMSMINYKFLTPMPSIIGKWVVCLLWMSIQDIFYLIRFGGFIGGLTNLAVLGSLLYMRKKCPNIARTIKVPLVVPLFLIVFTLAQLALTTYLKPVDSGIAVLVFLFGIPIYLIFIYWENKPKVILNLQDKVTIALQNFLLVVPQDKQPTDIF